MYKIYHFLIMSDECKTVYICIQDYLGYAYHFINYY